MKIKLSFFFTLLLLSILFTRCGNTEQTESLSPQSVDFKTYLLDSVICFKENFLRGAAIGQSRSAVLKTESAAPTDQDGDYLMFEYRSHPKINYSTVYTFVNDSLDEMEIRIDSDMDDLNAEIFSVLKTGLSKNLSAPNEDKGIVVFETKDLSGKKCYISIADNSTGGHSNINLLYYKEK